MNKAKISDCLATIVIAIALVALTAISTDFDGVLHLWITPSSVEVFLEGVGD